MTDQPVFLLHVGYPKAASSWMQRTVFAATPEIDVLSVVPEFRAALTNLQTPDEPFAEDEFRQLLATRHQQVDKPMLLTRESLIQTALDVWSGETPETANRLARLCPGARVLIVIRRQQDLLPSLFSQYVHEGGTKSLAAVLAGGDPAFPLGGRPLHMTETVEHYKSLFGDERVTVVPFELLRSDPPQFVDHLGRFLDLSLHERRIDSRPVNPSTVPAMLAMLRMWNRLFRASRFNASPAFGWMPGHLWGRKLAQGPASRLARRVGVTGTLELPDSELERLDSEFRDENARLQGHVSENLADLGYLV